MSYIEKKYNTKIKEVFDQLSSLDSSLLIQLKKKSVKNINEIAKLCADFNHNINLILKKYYPEIKGMDDKLDIKSTLKFYYDLIFKLTDLVRNIENFQNIDQEYYDKLVEFIHDKNKLISIGLAAKKAGISRQSLQYYIMVGLLEPTETTSTGRRMFNKESVERIRLIKRLNESGYSLRDIRETFLQDRGNLKGSISG